MDNESLGWMAFVVIVGLIIWGVFSTFSGNKDSSLDSNTNIKDCSTLLSGNPYYEGSGHYAGFEWAENNSGSYCNGNSDSFNEGCEEHTRQEENYSACLDR